LTDVVGIACRENEKVTVKHLADIGQILGINTLDDLEKTRNLADSV
jgi:bifunctional N-acetylglucosamine-1-phosphate-uridyltransferase/glucosamine-1-phosphate-acetyltransferase GlmU-like protein